MPIEFQLESRVVGISTNHALPRQTVYVRARELLGPDDPALVAHLEQMQLAIMSRIPRLPPPSLIDHLLVIVRPDLSGTAYVNELNPVATIKAARPIEAGSPVRLSDISAVSSFDLGVTVPADAGVVVIRSYSWKRSLYFDLTPLSPRQPPRAFPLEQVLAQQTMLLFGLGEATRTRLQHMQEGLALLRDLLETRCDKERSYQELVEKHPWMLGQYSAANRHTNLDDKHIPDFTATRSTDGFLDIVEFKQPFLRLFREDGEFGAPFNDALNQAEGYLALADTQKGYLRDQKALRFENPSCLLILGCDLTEPQQQRLREKEMRSRGIRILTFEQFFRQAEHTVSVAQAAGESIPVADVGVETQQTAGSGAP